MNIRFCITIVIFICSLLNSQFISELPGNNNLNNFVQSEEDYLNSVKKSNRLIINHGFSSSMISNGRTFYSMSGIDNNFSYNLFNNLTLNGNVGLYIVQSPLQKNNPLMEQMIMSYDASITYKPFKNSILQFRVQYIPRQSNHSLFYKRFNN